MHQRLFLSFFFHIYVYLKIRVTERGREVVFIGSPPKWPQEPGVGQVSAWNPRLAPGSPEGHECVPKYLAQVVLLSQAHSQEPCPEREQQGYEQVSGWDVCIAKTTAMITFSCYSECSFIGTKA